MKKYLFTALILLIGFIPFYVSAKDGKPSMTRLNEALASESIDIKNSSYNGSGNKVKIYIFRGLGCGYCRNLLTYLNSIINDYKDIVDINTYEVWYDADNSALMQSVAKAMGDEVGGVPYMIIGDKSFKGYSSNSNSSIINQIKKVNKAENPYDVMEHVGEVKSSNGNTTTTNNGNGNTYNNDLKTTSKEEKSSINVGEVIAWIIGVGLTLAGIIYITISKYKMKNAK
jgi:thiol-disulfide isomerase/thioredoxin